MCSLSPGVVVPMPTLPFVSDMAEFPSVPVLLVNLGTVSGVGVCARADGVNPTRAQSTAAQTFVIDVSTNLSDSTALLAGVISDTEPTPRRREAYFYATWI